jgi:hypothetical protein
VPRWSHSGFDFSERNIRQMRLFYLGWSNPQIISADSAAPSISQTLSAKSASWPLFPVPAKDEILPADAHVRDPFVLEFSGRRLARLAKLD